MSISKRLQELADKLEADANGMVDGVGAVCHHWAVRAGRALRECDKLPNDLQSIVKNVEASGDHDDAKSNTVFLQAVQFWMGNKTMTFEDMPRNPANRSKGTVGRYAENMRSLATALEPTISKRLQPDHKVTIWFRTHGRKYDSKAAAIRAYVEIHGGRYDKLYTDLNNDLRKKRPQSP